MKKPKCKAKHRVMAVFIISNYMVKKYGVQGALDRILARKVKQQPAAFLNYKPYQVTFKVPKLENMSEKYKRYGSKI